MPMPGTKPKPEGQRRTRVKSPVDWVEVIDTPFVGPSPRLPRREDGWPAMTKRWWSVIASMPHVILWSPSDWQFALDTAAVAARFHEGSVSAATELRNREKVLGTTMDARRDLRIRYVDALSDAPTAAVTDIGAYRAALDG